MHVLYQPAAAPIGDWLKVDAADWPDLPLEPVNAVNVQGVIFEADHYAVEVWGSGCRVHIWNDDPADFTPDQFHAATWEFPTLAHDPRVRALNTRQTLITYVAAAHPRTKGSQNETLAVWPDFIAPDPRLTRHGIWLTDNDYRDSVAARSQQGWRTWTET